MPYQIASAKISISKTAPKRTPAIGETPASLDSPGPNAAEEPAFVSSLARGIEVLLAFGGGKQRMTISDVSKATGMSRAAARRFLFTWASLGYLASDGRDYSLTSKVLNLSNTYVTSTPFSILAHRVVETIADKSYNACSLAVLEGLEATFIARAATRRLVSTALQVGSRIPAYCSSLGRVLLSGMTDSELDDYFAKIEIRKYTPHTLTNVAQLKTLIRKVRTDGYALVDQEVEVGLKSIAVPVRRPLGGVEAALGVGSTVHTKEQLLKEPRRHLLAGAAELSARLAY